MNILAMNVGRDGCSGYRILNPVKELKKIEEHQVFQLDGKENPNEMLELIEGSNVLIFRQEHIRLFNFIKEKIDTSKKLLVIDMDDDIFNTSPFSETYRWGGVKDVEWQGKKLWEDGENDFRIERNKKALDEVVKVFKKADLITCTTECLKNRLIEISGNKNVAVLPNAISEHWKKWDLKKEDTIRIGWTGGATHYIDWHTIMNPLRKVFKKNKNIKLVLQGCKWDGTIKDIPHEFHDWIDFEGHPYKTASLNIDIAVIPLADNKFNRSKSCIKWYEFSSLGIPSLVADVSPYKEEVKDKALTFKNEKEFEKNLQRLIDDGKLRKEVGDKSKKWVEKHRKLENIAKDYVKVYKKALKRKKTGQGEEIK